jgi:dUTP pyrophosphatase
VKVLQTGPVRASAYAARMRRREQVTPPPVLQVKRLDPELPLPSYAHPGDAGLDLCAADTTVLGPGERALIPTGVAVAIPEGFAGLVHPRSGLAVDHGLTLLNSPGTIDTGYRGEVKVLLINHGQQSVTLTHGQRIAQLLLVPVARVDVVEVELLDVTVRGERGFGSSGS